jgi:NADH-quinone oxidoreductase subunit E
MAGGRELIEHLCKKLGVKVGEVTKDGKFCISRAECLGSCDTAPVMQVNIEPYKENLTVEKLDQIVDGLR